MKRICIDLRNKNPTYTSFASHQSRGGYLSSLTTAAVMVWLAWCDEVARSNTEDCKLWADRCGTSFETTAVQHRHPLMFTCIETLSELSAVSRFELEQRLAESSEAMSDVWQRGERCHHGWVVWVSLAEAKGCRFNPCSILVLPSGFKEWKPGCSPNVYYSHRCHLDMWLPQFEMTHQDAITS